MNETTPIKNVRPVTMLFADAPSSFSEMAEAAELVFVEEATEAGTRYVIDFNELDAARRDHPLVRQLTTISAEPRNGSFRQICLEVRCRVGLSWA
ncbi:MAG: hypothetical protein Q8N18_22430 [Opitutaceae bacterium]|nr:hypothetical protein [Opitutaceae bacterium]